MNIPQQQVIVTVSEEPHRATKYKSVFMGLGVTQVCIGVLCIILSGIGLSPELTDFFYYLGSGLWTGIMIIPAGALGIASGARPNKCNIIAGMVMAILAAIISVIAGALEAVTASTPCFIISRYIFCPSEEFKGIHGTLAFLCFLEFIISIVHSSYCCAGCCGSGNNRVQVVPATTNPTSQIPMVAYEGQPQQKTQQQPQYQQQQPMHPTDVNVQQPQSVYNPNAEVPKQPM